MPINRDALKAMSYEDKNIVLDSVFKPLVEPLYTVHMAASRAYEQLSSISLDYGAALDLTPDYQRGHVWSEAQQKDFIAAIFRRSIPESAMVLQFNCSNWDTFHEVAPNADLPKGLQCLDGLQRLTAFTRFANNEIDVAGLYADDLSNTRYSVNRQLFQFRVNIYSFHTRQEVLEHYLAINAGGTPHSPAEIERVKGLLDKAKGLSRSKSSPGLG